ncbi:hypothetical protein [Glycomyces xiaoerkulensis]|uniref:hypothetical protein n=1 Tax=Glycomyces xiaoerkulensis TaxID=2038139 RepID=UPI000C25D208|nr:hypothetical protein [Glycomyces xiaoerkulensis]
MYAPNASYLRVYEPAGVFADADYWRAYAASGRAVDPREGPKLRREALYERIGWPWRIVPSFPREAYVIDAEEEGGDPLICPWNLRYRIAQSAMELRRLTPEPVAEALVPADFLASAAEIVAHDEGRDRHEAPADTHEQVASWSVPLRWFACVRPEDRELVAEDGRRLRYLTPITGARTRLTVARNRIRAEFGDEADLAAALTETLEWLEGFDDGALVELDYGGLVSRMGDRELSEEDSVDLTWEAIDHLGDGEPDAAQDCYARLVERWRDRRLAERLN